MLNAGRRRKEGGVSSELRRQGGKKHRCVRGRLQTNVRGGTTQVVNNVWERARGYLGRHGLGAGGKLMNRKARATATTKRGSG